MGFLGRNGPKKADYYEIYNAIPGFIHDYVLTHGRSPTFKEIATHFKTNASRVQAMAIKLSREGRVVYNFSKRRCLSVPGGGGSEDAGI